MVALKMESDTVQAIYTAYASAHDEDERTYLGASIIGEECWRKLWYGFRWATVPEQFDGRMLRLFQTGHREEARIIDDLRRSSVEVWETDPETGGQFAVSEVGGHFKGHADGIAIGVKEAPKTPHLLEVKTHNAKSFKKLLAEGVRMTKPLHYAQMQTYMHLLSLTRALYVAHGKDDDALYAERVEYDSVYAAQIVAKAQSIITAARPPQKLHEDPTRKMAFGCVYCPALSVCHQGAWPRRNCRTCIEATPKLDGDGRWFCEHHKQDLTKEDQKQGCKAHRLIPELVNGEQVDCDPEKRTIVYAMNDGSTWVDGENHE
jgi:hypothetical protein